MLRDIDYAALAVQRAIVEKFGKQRELDALKVEADESVIVVRDGNRQTVGTRDDLLAALRNANDYDEFLPPR